MEEKTQIKTFLGSKLPKYGTKSVRSTLQPMPNGTPVNLLGTSKNSNVKSYIKNNGSDCPSSHSFNWRKTNKYQLCAQGAEEPNNTQNSHDKIIDPEKRVPTQGMFDKNGIKGGLKSVSLFTSKLAKPSTMFVSSTEELNQKSFSGPSNLGKFTKGTLLGRTSYSSVSTPKSQLNGFYGNRSAGSMQRPRANSCATRSSSGESLAQSPDSSKSINCEKMVRSQSFSHSIQNSFLPPSSITRSHSFNRAVDLTKPYQNQQLSIRVPLRSSMLTRNCRQPEVLNGNEHLGYGFNRPYAAGGKKLALPNGPGVTSTLGYRMVHPSLLKSSRSPFSGTMTVDGNKNSPADTCVEEDATVLAKDRAANKDQELIENESYRTKNNQTMKHDAKIRYLSDDVDDISLSSLSSSDKNDLSEDFSDDFIDIEDSNRTRITPEEMSLKEEKHENRPPQDMFDSPKENEKAFSKTDEWIDISVSDRSECTKHTSGNNLVSPDTDYRAGSSFELSPSDSSDGTYMWDEEGLEPIGNVHPVGSYESSEMNSIDILNNLESCDLEDDDLMLDVDLPEDAPLENVECDNMNRFDRPDRNVRQPQEGFWKRPPQRWSGQEHYHLSHPDHYHHHGKSDLSRGSPYRESPLGHFESYGGMPFFQAQKMFVDVPENTVILDEMTLRHMVQDCTAVKTQLLKLKRLLHQHDGSGSLHDIQLSLPSSPEPEDGDKVYKNEDLLNEIKQLKEEIKKKDEKIQLLELQLATQHICHQKCKEEKYTYADKYTQTPWRRIPPQVLQPSSSLPRPTDHTQGKLIKPQRIEARSECAIQDMHQGIAHPEESFTHVLQQESNYGLEEQPFSSGPQLTMDVAKSTPSEANLNITVNAQEPYHLANNQISDMQFIPTSLQTPPESSTVDQAKRVGRNQSPPVGYTSQPKSLQLLKPSILSSLVPPPVSESSPSRTPTCKKSPIITTCNSAKLQPTSSQTNVANNQNLKASKLRPPSGSFKQKQTNSPQLEPQSFQAKTSIPRPLTQRKEIMQNPNGNLHSGDCLASNRYSRLPKPKIH
ncbi:serine-rich coiled-coil domain-containing protein 2 isoform X1 [Pongo pygmaeus]|uniref:serine-rich coiled-coil domain-containing protein 2 isoform X1 n=1 Tax=Pongo pygmaeus TaxID=9600 RepID=UPI0023E28CE5|nr:serine-rich coiled-coil domain-containing protein 2 isoform X1 [Pongo pygmaeus]XP_054358987.1 serine-rich coiled-coil domain-containing protein 2 isoform X1 [Pongo pygmaeus]XP_054358988.1 serine-rich coiled-coil domain-containing protein 2 isoform X1 [Pongo pygmaeus]XP_054358989.1 serine-rich coiled-coil domain-containing protein 2 isoform X1 [Pongo pygmaeus]XP_054358990.1 serine-rich coiled-coil domain-containing protein 2 isoform X1 [Pongo pygmaeus]